MLWGDQRLALRRVTPDVASAPSAADLWVYGLTFGPAILMLGALWYQPYVPLAFLMKDPFAVAGQAGECCRFYYGIVSNFGVLVWWAAAAVCAFAAALLFALGRGRPEIAFLAAAAVFTGWLALDDLFMIHDDVLPWFGVRETVTYAFYAALAAIYLLCGARLVLRLRPLLLGIAFALLGTSVAIDVLVVSDSDLRLFIEDGAKFLGILSWSSFHACAAFQLSIGAMAQPRVVLVGRAGR